MLLAHAQIYENYKKMNLKGKVGLTLTGDFGVPFHGGPSHNHSADQHAARAWNTFHINWILQPLLDGDWPKMMSERIPASRLPRFTPAEKELVRDSVDFVGLMHTNYKLVSYKERQTDIEPESFQHDMNVTVIPDWRARQTSAVKQRISKTAQSVFDSLKWVNSVIEESGKEVPIIFMAGVAGESDAVEDLEKRRRNMADTAITSDHQKQVMTHRNAVKINKLKNVRHATHQKLNC